MFDDKHSAKCSCMHCRGGHVELPSDNNNHTHYNIENNEFLFEVDQTTPEELLAEYLEAILDCTNKEEVAEILAFFFEDVSAMAIQELYLAEIQSKIEVLNMLKAKREEE